MAKINWKRVLNCIAFIGLVFIAFALLLGKVLNWFGVQASITSTIQSVGEWCAYVVTAIYAGMFIRGKRKAWWWIVYFVALTLVVVLVILK